VQASAQFVELRRTHRSFAFPLTIAFVAWYLLYVLLTNYADGIMDANVGGHLNVAFVFGLAQFLTTFLIAWWYSRRAAAQLDPRAADIRSRLAAGLIRDPQDDAASDPPAGPPPDPPAGLHRNRPIPGPVRGPVRGPGPEGDA
jgi:uncharacterized membrane protein (DUF485 family)